MNRGGFSWKRFFGISKTKSRIARATGIPTTKSGRQRKAGKILTGGCLTVMLKSLLLTTCVIIFLCFVACSNDSTETVSSKESSPDLSVTIEPFISENDVEHLESLVSSESSESSVSSESSSQSNNTSKSEPSESPSSSSSFESIISESSRPLESFQSSIPNSSSYESFTSYSESSYSESSREILGIENYHGYVYTGGDSSTKYHYEADCAGKYSHEITWEYVDQSGLKPCGTCVLK